MTVSRYERLFDVAFHRVNDPRRLHALIDAMLLIETDADLHDLLQVIIEAATQLVGARYGALGVVTSDGETLSQFITYGIDDETRDLIGELPRGRGLLGEVIRHPESLRVEHIAEHGGSVGFPANHPAMDHFLGVPVKTGNGHIYGNLYLTDREDGEPFSEEDEQLVDSFGRAAGLVIDQVTLRAHLREFTLGQERERLARDLHDTVIQRLFGVGLSLQLALSTPNDETAKDRINNCINELDTTIREIRTTIFEIDQNEFDGATLASRLTMLTDEVGARLNLQVELRVDPVVDDVASSSCTRHTVHALREILSNIVRHSRASAVSVDVGVDAAAQLIVVTVTDNGVGFANPIGPGRGLRNLTARAHELGGDCVIDSVAGRGTMVRWTAKL
jgi:signal transduction histidine kinase